MIWAQSLIVNLTDSILAVLMTLCILFSGSLDSLELLCFFWILRPQTVMWPSFLYSLIVAPAVTCQLHPHPDNVRGHAQILAKYVAWVRKYGLINGVRGQAVLNSCWHLAGHWPLLNFFSRTQSPMPRMTHDLPMAHMASSVVQFQRPHGYMVIIVINLSIQFSILFRDLRSNQMVNDQMLHCLISF